MASIIAQAFERAFSAGEQSPAAVPYSRKALIDIDVPSSFDPVDVVSLDEARTLISTAMLDYAALPEPNHMLLVKAPAGTGKTQAAVRLAEALAKQGQRVLYLVPRHGFVADVLALAQHPTYWYEWQPRQEAKGDCQETCRYGGAMNTWLYRGYEAIKLCEKLCRWDYVQNECPWHAQKKVQAQHPIIIGQHLHLTSGHPLDFDIIIGDEYPMDAFMRDWEIPAQFVAYRLPHDLDPAIVTILETLQRLCQMLPTNEHGTPIPLSGPELLDRLGGASVVLQIIQAYVLALEQPEPFVNKPTQVDKVPYRFIPALLLLLDRECRLALTGKPYPHRLILTNGNLHILQKREINARMPERCIWLDATADPYLYERVFERRIETIAPQIERRSTVYQVWSSTNNRGKLLTKDEAKAEQVKHNLDNIQAQIQAIVQRGYEHPTIISYKNLMDEFSYQSGYFGAARGTNSFVGTDCLIIVGTPQTAPHDLENEAKMLFWERDDPFHMELTERVQPYGRSGKGMLVNGYWADTDLQALHLQKRDAELIQVAYRARPLQHDVDIWLLTSHPIDGLAPDKLISLQELFMAPDNINPYLWQRFTDYIADKDFISTPMIATDLAIEQNTARRLIIALIKHRDEWHVESVSRQRGRPATAAARNKNS